MAVPHTAEPTIRILDAAVFDWVRNFRVDYRIPDPITGEIDETRNNLPVHTVFASPDRAFAAVADQLVKNGFINEANDEFKRAKAEYDWAVLPLPVVTIERDEPTPSNLLQMPPTLMRQMFTDENGNYVPVGTPLHYITVYRFTFWSKTRYTHSHFMEWVLGQQGLPGAGPQEILIPVKHQEPWGTILHALRYTESANLSTLEGDDPRYIRTQLTFTLRSWLFRAFPEASRAVDSVYSVNGDVSDSLSDVATASGAFNPSETLNLFSYIFPDGLVSSMWPVFGDASVTVGGTGKDKSLDISLTSNVLDRVPILRKIAVKGTDGRCFIMLSMEFESDAPFEIQVRSFVNATELIPASETVVRSRVVPTDFSTKKRRVHMFSFVTGDQFSIDICSTGVAAEVSCSDIDVRQVKNLVRIPATTYSTDAGVRTYEWRNRPNTPQVLFVVPVSGAGTVTAWNDPAKVVGRSATLEGVDVVGLLTQPANGTAVLTVPTAIQVSDVFLVDYVGSYKGDFDGYASP